MENGPKIADLPIQDGGFPVRHVSLPEGKTPLNPIKPAFPMVFLWFSQLAMFDEADGSPPFLHHQSQAMKEILLAGDTRFQWRLGGYASEVEV